MKPKELVKMGGQVLAVVAMVRAIQQARAEGDRLRLADAVVNGLGVATTVAIVVREIRENRSERSSHPLDPRK